MVKANMWTRTLVLSMSSLVILATSFCAHRNQHSRSVSSTEVSSEFQGVEPLIVSSSQGDKLYIYVKEHNERSSSILVEVLCQGSDEPPLFWEMFKVEVFAGVSQVQKDGTIRVRYKPLGLLKLDTKAKTPSAEELASAQLRDNPYPIDQACRR